MGFVIRMQFIAFKYIYMHIYVGRVVGFWEWCKRLCSWTFVLVFSVIWGHGVAVVQSVYSDDATWSPLFETLGNLYTKSNTLKWTSLEHSRLVRSIRELIAEVAKSSAILPFVIINEHLVYWCPFLSNFRCISGMLVTLFHRKRHYWNLHNSRRLRLSCVCCIRPPNVRLHVAGLREFPVEPNYLHHIQFGISYGIQTYSANKMNEICFTQSFRYNFILLDEQLTTIFVCQHISSRPLFLPSSLDFTSTILCGHKLFNWIRTHFWPFLTNLDQHRFLSAYCFLPSFMMQRSLPSNIANNFVLLIILITMNCNFCAPLSVPISNKRATRNVISHDDKNRKSTLWTCKYWSAQIKRETTDSVIR